jgi:very-short-patch-repair endonuclease
MRGPQPAKITRARSLRRSDNEAEARLWTELRNRRLNGFKFVRQYPIGRYFADFACREANLVIELDGSQHADSRYDRRRDEFMNAEGWSVARFANGGVFDGMEEVLETIVAILDGRLTEEQVSIEFRFCPTNREHLL